MHDDVLFSELTGREGDIGVITLNRPKFLNALNQAMCIAIDERMTEWERTPRIKAVVICGAGDRAFCAGGDIRSIYDARDRPEIGRQFFWHEYRLNYHIHHYRKPYIALLNGVTMGGGAGLSVPGRYRVGTEKLMFAMPETGIGFFPDVGGSYYLSRCRGKSGYYLGLTGTPIKNADAFYAGLINYTIPSASLPELMQQLTDVTWHADAHRTVDQLLTAAMHSVDGSVLAAHAAIIDHCFAQESVEAIIAALDQQNSDWAAQAAQQLSSRSPISLKVVLEQLQRGGQLDFGSCLQMEYRIADRFLHTGDFFEGVRAAIVDKDKMPHWHPDSLAQITASDVARYFAPLVDVDELAFVVESEAAKL